MQSFLGLFSQRNWTIQLYLKLLTYVSYASISYCTVIKMIKELSLNLSFEHSVQAIIIQLLQNNCLNRFNCPSPYMIIIRIY